MSGFLVINMLRGEEHVPSASKRPQITQSQLQPNPVPTVGYLLGYAKPAESRDHQQSNHDTGRERVVHHHGTTHRTRYFRQPSGMRRPTEVVIFRTQEADPALRTLPVTRVYGQDKKKKKTY